MYSDTIKLTDDQREKARKYYLNLAKNMGVSNESIDSFVEDGVTLLENYPQHFEREYPKIEHFFRMCWSGAAIQMPAAM